MKTLTLTSEFFQNECAESFCKAIQGNILLDVKNPYDPNYFIASSFKMFVCTNLYNWSDSGLIKHDSITFKLDDSFSVDFRSLFDYERSCFDSIVFNEFGEKPTLNLDYLAKLQGVEIKEAGE